MIVTTEFSRKKFERDIAPLLNDPEVFRSVGCKLLHYVFPSMRIELAWSTANKTLVLQIEADDYDYRPVRGWWSDGSGAPILKGALQLPSGNGFQVDPNPYTEPRSWFCFPGWREYHDHSGHQNPSWASLRGRSEYKILALITHLQSQLNKPGITPA